MKAVGGRLPKLDARELVRGKATYTADMRLPGLVYARTKRSDQAHALLRTLDTSRAAAVPGVECVLTARDIPGENRMGIITMDQQLLVEDRVRYKGDNLALVVGDKRAIEEALGLIEATYDPLPLVLDPVEALKEEAPKIHGQSNVTCAYNLVKGDVEKAFAACDVVVEGIYHTPFQQHAYLEPEVALAVPEPSGRMTVYVGCQGIYRVRSTVARALGVPHSFVRVVQSTTGGSFGGKPDVNSEMGALAAVAAARTGRPVMINHSREEASIGSSVRHAARIHHRTGATSDGRLLARDVNVVLDGGVYSSLSPFVAVKALAHAAGPYDVPNVRSKVTVAYTNKTYAGACRGFGVPQVTFAAERQMDELAEALGLDPLELRLKNALDAGGATATGQKLRSGVGLKETIRKAAEAAGWPGRSGSKAEPSARGASAKTGHEKARGIGVACMMQGVSLGAEGVDNVQASCHLSVDGSVLVGSGIMDMGQGTYTAFAQLTADILGLPVERVRVRGVDTDHTPDCGPTVASRGTTVGGRAVVLAAEAAREKILAMGARLLETTPGQLRLADGLVRSASDPARNVPLSRVVNALYWSGQPISFEAWSKAPDAAVDKETHQGDYYITFGYGTHIAEVEVDTETGQVTVLRHIAAHDVGKAINPLAVEGQIEGATVMGLGYGLLEEIVYGPDGTMLNPNFTDYLLPTAADTPDIEVIIVETPGEWGPHGAKGVGEFPVAAAGAALANAISNALGVQVRRLPVTPEYVLELLKEAERPI